MCLRPRGPASLTCVVLHTYIPIVGARLDQSQTSIHPRLFSAAVLLELGPFLIDLE